MLKNLQRFVDYFVAAEDKTVKTELRIGRFFVITLLVIVLFSLINFWFFVKSDKANTIDIIGSFLMTGMTVVILIAYRSWGKRVVLVNIFAVFSFLLIASLSYRDTGGIYSSDMSFFIFANAWIYLLAGRRSGTFWFLISCAILTGMYIAEVTSAHTFREVYAGITPDYHFMNYLSGLVFLYLIIAINRKNNDTYLEEIHEKQAVIEQKNTEILESINYARRLQEAILPPMKLVREVFDDYFVLYKPKDIVAGDFYWMERRDHHVFFAVADCTGHGVPGALVSVVCSNALNHAVREFKLTDPGAILDKVSELVQDTFAKSGNDVNDGMDISLIAMDTQSRKVKWAGANNAVWFIRNGTLKEIRPDKQPVGRFEFRKLFTTHGAEVKSGDVVYLFTDGYADQFGGSKGKKFKYKQLQKVLLQVHQLPMDKQEQKLAETLAAWQGNLEQVDDICVVGIRFN